MNQWHGSVAQSGCHCRCHASQELVAQELGVCTKMADRLVGRGALPHPARCARFNREELAAFPDEAIRRM